MKLKYTYLDDSIELLFPNGAEVEVGDVIHIEDMAEIDHNPLTISSIDESGQVHAHLNGTSVPICVWVDDPKLRLLRKAYPVEAVDGVAIRHVEHGIAYSYRVYKNRLVQGEFTSPSQACEYYDHDTTDLWRFGGLEMFTQSGQQVVAKGCSDEICS